MLCFGRIDVSEKIDANKTRYCDICHYWYFLDKASKFQPNVWHGFHDVLMMSMNLGYIAIQNIHCADYRCVITGISKSEAISLMQNIDLTEKSGTLEKIIFFTHLKMDEETLTFGDIEVKNNQILPPFYC